MLATISILLQREMNVRDLYFPVARLSQLFTTIHVCSSLSFVRSEPFLFSRGARMDQVKRYNREKFASTRTNHLFNELFVSS